MAHYIGGAPPPGNGRHRYAIVVQALDIEKAGQIGVQADSTPAWLGFSINTGGHLLGRAVITPWAQIPARMTDLPPETGPASSAPSPQ